MPQVRETQLGASCNCASASPNARTNVHSAICAFTSSDTQLKINYFRLVWHLRSDRYARCIYASSCRRSAELNEKFRNCKTNKYALVPVNLSATEKLMTFRRWPNGAVSRLHKSYHTIRTRACISVLGQTPTIARVNAKSRKCTISRIYAIFE